MRKTCVVESPEVSSVKVSTGDRQSSGTVGAVNSAVGEGNSGILKSIISMQRPKIDICRGHRGNVRGRASPLRFPPSISPTSTVGNFAGFVTVESKKCQMHVAHAHGKFSVLNRELEKQ